MLNKKAQVGDAITWIVATIVIVVILLFFVFGSSLLAETKDIGTFRQSLTSTETFEGDDLFLKKSIYSYYSINSDGNRRIMEGNLKEMEREGKFNLEYDETKVEVSNNLNIE